MKNRIYVKQNRKTCKFSKNANTDLKRGVAIKSRKSCLTKNEKYSLFQSMIDEAISKLKNICETMDFEDPNSEVISFDACDYLETLIDIKIVDIPNDTTIKVRTKYDYIFPHKDDEAFIYELQIALKKYRKFKIDVEESINIKTRQW